MRPQDSKNDWHQQKTYESLMTYGTNAIKFTVLSNGGAILSILTFLGNHPERVSSIKSALYAFLLGIFCGGLANIFAYFSQLALFNQRSDVVSIIEDHRTWLNIFILLLAVGLVCFGAGGYLAVKALQ